MIVLNLAIGRCMVIAKNHIVDINKMVGLSPYHTFLDRPI